MIDVGRAIVAVNRDDQRETDGGFRGGDRDGEDRDHHAGRRLRLRAETPEGDEIQVRRGEHHLDADENENGVPPAQRGEQADAKERGGNDEEKCECRVHSSFLLHHENERADQARR